MCWGDNSNGMCGDGTSGNTRLVPVAASGMSNVVNVATAAYSTFGLRADGTLWGWGGYGNSVPTYPLTATQIPFSP
jgi:alpha-tubulin suppressor-like RCC1 family protein